MPRYKHEALYAQNAVIVVAVLGLIVIYALLVGGIVADSIATKKLIDGANEVARIPSAMKIYTGFGGSNAS